MPAKDNIMIWYFGEPLSVGEIEKKVDAVIAPESGEFDIYQLVACAAELKRYVRIIEQMVRERDASTQAQ